jgi:DnaJ-domain-containing protein 1
MKPIQIYKSEHWRFRVMDDMDRVTCINLHGVPQIPHDCDITIRRFTDDALDAEQIARCDKAITAAMQEIRRRYTAAGKETHGQRAFHKQQTSIPNVFRAVIRRPHHHGSYEA